MSRRLVVGTGLLALALVSIAIAVLVRTMPAPTPDPSPTPSPTQTTVAQQTLMIAVRDDEGDIADSVVIGTDSTVTPPVASWLSMQPGLEMGVTNTAVLTLAGIGPDAPQDSALNVSNLLGFNVNGAMVLDRLAFAALVDGVGGVTVNPAYPIVALAPNGTSTVVVKAGERKIYGPTAAAYVITLNAGENQTARMDRFNEVFQQIIQKLPGNLDKVRSIIGSLGSSSRISLAPETIAEILLELQTAQNDQAVTNGIPQTTARGNSAAALYLVNPAENQPVMTKLFAQSILVPGQNGAYPRVRLMAAGITNDSVLRVQQEMLNDNLTMVWGGEIAPVKHSVIFIPDEASRPLVQQIVTTLGLTSPDVRINPKQTIGVQASIKLGRDTTMSSATATPSPTGS